MGNANVGDRNQLSQWSRSEYANANNRQDDLVIITGQNGFGYRPDDHNITIPTATPLTVGPAPTIGNFLSGKGIIEQTSDVDCFKFTTTSSGTVTLSIDPFYRSPNLDVLANLYSATNTLLATSNPANSLSASFNLNLAAGTYFVCVDGAGSGNALSTGYSDYGSLGRYSISGFVQGGASSQAASVSAPSSALMVSVSTGAVTSSTTSGTASAVPGITVIASAAPLVDVSQSAGKLIMAAEPKVLTEGVEWKLRSRGNTAPAPKMADGNVAALSMIAQVLMEWDDLNGGLWVCTLGDS